MLERWLQSDQIQKGSVVLVSNQVRLVVLSTLYLRTLQCGGFLWEEVLVELHSGKLERRGRKLKTTDCFYYPSKL